MTKSGQHICIPSDLIIQACDPGHKHTDLFDVLPWDDFILLVFVNDDLVVRRYCNLLTHRC